MTECERRGVGAVPRTPLRERQGDEDMKRTPRGLQGFAGPFWRIATLQAYPGRARGSREGREKGDVCVLGYIVCR